MKVGYVLLTGINPLPLCSNTLKHCLLETSQTLAVQSFDPDNNTEPSIDNDRLLICMLKK